MQLCPKFVVFERRLDGQLILLIMTLVIKCGVSSTAEKFLKHLLSTTPIRWSFNDFVCDARWVLIRPFLDSGWRVDFLDLGTDTILSFAWETQLLSQPIVTSAFSNIREAGWWPDDRSKNT